MSIPRLVMASGTAPGAGKSTLIAHLADALPPRHGGATVITEDDVWGQRRLDDESVDYRTARVEFIELLHSDGPQTPSALLATFDRVAASISLKWWLQDWTWQSLALLVASREGPSEIDHDLRARLAKHQAVVLYLRLDPLAALSRAVTERGKAWLSRHATGLGLHGADIEQVASLYGRREESRLDALTDNGVPHIILDGGRATETVVDDAIAALTA